MSKINRAKIGYLKLFPQFTVWTDKQVSALTCCILLCYKVKIKNFSLIIQFSTTSNQYCRSQHRYLFTRHNKLLTDSMASNPHNISAPISYSSKYISTTLLLSLKYKNNVCKAKHVIILRSQRSISTRSPLLTIRTTVLE